MRFLWYVAVRVGARVVRAGRRGSELRLYWNCLAHCGNGGTSAVHGASVEFLFGWTLHNAGIEISLGVGFRVGGVRPAGCGWAAG